MDKTILDAYKTVVRNELQHMEYILSAGEMETLVCEIADSEDFWQHLAFCVQDAAEFWAEHHKIDLYKGEDANV